MMLTQAISPAALERLLFSRQVIRTWPDGSTNIMRLQAAVKNLSGRMPDTEEEISLRLLKGEVIATPLAKFQIASEPGGVLGQLAARLERRAIMILLDWQGRTWLWDARSRQLALVRELEDEQARCLAFAG